MDKKAMLVLRGQDYEINPALNISHYIEKIYEKYKHKVAIKYKNREYSFNTVEKRVNIFISYLLRHDVKSGVRVGVYLDPSHNQIFLLLALLKIGAIYVPLDKSYPIARIEYILEDCDLNVIVTDEKNLQFETEVSNYIKIQEIKTNKVVKLNELSYKLISPNDDAYIIYTSGSTGRPKGVVVSQKALINHMLWLNNQFYINSNDIILFKTPVSFDPSIWEMLLSFFNGATLVIAPKNYYMLTKKLIEIIEENEVTCIQFVPSLFYEFLKNPLAKNCTSLKYFFCGGESLTSNMKQLFFETFQAKLINLYGPSETTIDITYFQIHNRKYEIKTDIIGKPIHNTELYVLDENLNTVEEGEVGELYIASLSLANGYLNNPDSTAKAFIENPFFNSKFKYLYKTGDMVKVTHSNMLTYVQRNNELMKINGVRVEPGEIKNYLLEHFNIENCIITKMLSKNYTPYLVAYIVPKHDEPINIELIKKKVSAFFPFYMCPKKYITLKALPKTMNGKVDLNALLKSYVNDEEYKITLMDRFGYKIMYALIVIWEALLNIEVVNSENNFFELGGTSLLCLQLVKEIKKEFQITIALSDVFLHQSLQQQTDFILEELTKEEDNEKDRTDHLFKDSMIQLFEGTEITPLFLIHPIGGSVFWYNKLSHVKNSDRTVYAIQDPGLNTGNTYFTSIEKMAENYYRMIKRVQPYGPYFIGGASFGATVALEIASIIEKNHDKVLIVPILDGWAYYPNALSSENYFKNSMQHQYNEMMLELINKNQEIPENILKVQKHRLSLLQKYKFKKIKSNIALFKAKDMLPIFKNIDDKNNHWDKLISKKMATFMVPGNHETMFSEPNVQVLSKLLFDLLDVIEQTYISTSNLTDSEQSYKLERIA